MGGFNFTNAIRLLFANYGLQEQASLPQGGTASTSCASLKMSCVKLQRLMQLSVAFNQIQQYLQAQHDTILVNYQCRITRDCSAQLALATGQVIVAGGRGQADAVVVRLPNWGW